MWVNSISLRSPTLRMSDLRRALGKVGSFLFSQSHIERAVDSAGSEFLVINPLAVPFNGNSFVRWLNKRLLGRVIRRHMIRHSIEAPVVITVNPTAALALVDMDAVAKIYYCADQYGAHPGVDPGMVSAMEDKLYQSCDAVVVVSKSLLQDKGRYHQNVHYIPHGVDIEKFARPSSDRPAIVSELAGLDGPIVGYLGSIGRHFDRILFLKLTELLPDVNFVVAGRLEEGLQFPTGRNIHFVGYVDYDNVPDYLGYFEVAIIPWLNTERVLYANPTKAREYLASGCPVVSTEHPELAELSPYIEFASSATEFAEKICELLGEKKPSKEDVTRSVAGHSWAARAEDFQNVIEKVVVSK
jgi:glycosyltransferase involved in cell wall biosynthesis